jgi:MFS family permease
MTEIPAPAPVPEVTASTAPGPVRKVPPGWIALNALAVLGLYVGYYGPQEVLLPDQAQSIAGNGHVVAFAWISGIGAVVAMVAQPLAGALSDRTVSRLGRRHPWTLGGALVAAAGLALLAMQVSLIGVIICWCVALAGLHAMQASLTAAVPDHVPVRQRGSVAGWIGLQMTLGVVVAVALVSLIFTGNGGYVLIALIVMVLAAPFATFTPDPPLAPEARPPFAWREFARSFWVSPRRYPDFAWAWGTRFAVMLGDSIAVLYLLYFLRDRLHVADAEKKLLYLILVYTAGVLLSAVLGGRLSDRSGRRKPLVVAAGLVMAVPAVMLAIWPNWWMTVACALLLGLGFGLYLAVDLALVTQVLPSQAGHAKDLGIINVAVTGSQALAPAIAAPVVDFFGYSTLYVMVAVITLLGSAFVWKIRSVA